MKKEKEARKLLYGFVCRKTIIFTFNEHDTINSMNLFVVNLLV